MIKPPFTKLRLRLDFPSGNERLRIVMPFKRSWIAILILAAIDTTFSIPAVSTFQEATEHWDSLDNLFDLVSAIFLSSWLLGWMIAPLIMTVILILMLFGREVLTIHKDYICIGIGAPGLLVEMQYEAKRIRNLRHVVPDKQSGNSFSIPVLQVGVLQKTKPADSPHQAVSDKQSGTSWRGPHLVFDYGSQEIAFGSMIDKFRLPEIKNRIELAAGTSLRKGEALPETLKEEARLKSELESKDKKLPQEEQPLSTTKAKPLTLRSPSTVALIIANLIPVMGTVFLGWRLSDVMVLYWAESAIIGFFNVLKIAFISRWFVLLAGPFFIGHFGGFMAVHFLFIYGFFIQGVESFNNGGDLLQVAQLFFDLWPALLALFVSHAISFHRNFIGRKEYLGRTAGDQMGEPYGRIIFMHITIIFGGGLSMILGEPTPVLLLVIAAKIIVDVKAHFRERNDSHKVATQENTH